MKKIISLLVTVFALCAVINMCNTDAEAAIGVKSIEISVNGSAKLVVPSSLSKKSRNVKWKSSDSRIVKVNKKGVIKGIKPGKAKVTMVCGKKRKIIKVVVRNYSSQTAIPTAIPINKPTEKPVVIATALPMPSATPKPIRTSNFFVCDIVDEVLYLSKDISYRYECTINKNNWKDKNVSVKYTNPDTYKEEAVNWDSIEVGDYISVNYHGLVLYSYPASFTAIDGIVINQKHPWLKTKKYTYTVTEKNGDTFIYKDEYGRIYSQNSKEIVGPEDMKFFINDTEVTYDELKVGDEICLRYNDGRYAHPLIKAVQRVEIIR